MRNHMDDEKGRVLFVIIEMTNDEKHPSLFVVVRAEGSVTVFGPSWQKMTLLGTFFARMKMRPRVACF